MPAATHARTSSDSVRLAVTLIDALTGVLTDALTGVLTDALIDQVVSTPVSASVTA